MLTFPKTKRLTFLYNLLLIGVFSVSEHSIYSGQTFWILLYFPLLFILHTHLIKKCWFYFKNNYFTDLFFLCAVKSLLSFDRTISENAWCTISENDWCGLNCISPKQRVKTRFIALTWPYLKYGILNVFELRWDQLD